MKDVKKERKPDNPREGGEDGGTPPHRDFKERSVVLAVDHPRASTFSYLSLLAVLTLLGLVLALVRAAC
jgi:hypothetical protein